MPHSANVFDGTAKKQINFSSNITAEDGFVFTAPVGRFRENGFGLFDMHGNVNEWCSDWYGADYYVDTAAVDPAGPPSGLSRVQRGGSWLSYAGYCRSAYRYFNAPDFRSYYLGFRVAVG